MKAKIISNLSGIAVDGEHFEPHGTIQHVAHMPRVGVICQIKLGANGLQYCRAGVATYVIPREQLVALFEKLEPQFAALPDGNTRPREVDQLGAPANVAASRQSAAEIPPQKESPKVENGV